MRARAAVVLLAALSLPSCDKKANPRPAPIAHAQFKFVPLKIAASAQREALRDAYRLRPDYRFLLAFGEIRRVADGKPGPPGEAATATFERGSWTLRLGETQLGALPELPDFSDCLPLLVAYAGRVLRAPDHQGSPPSAQSETFLMPGLLSQMRPASIAGQSTALTVASEAFARLAFQMSDRLELAPLIHARALALLAAGRSMGISNATEEVFVAHALGYTHHAEVVARTLPRNSPARLFETLDDRVLREMAERPGASEESRYLALRRAMADGDFSSWKAARERLFANDNSASVVATGFALELPMEMELVNTREVLVDALPRAAVRELTSGAAPEAEQDPNGPFESRLESESATLRGLLWDRDALTAYYDGMFYSTLDPEYRPGMEKRPIPDRLHNRLVETPPQPDGRGVPLFADQAENELRPLEWGDPRVAAVIRQLMLRLDSRPSHRARLARLSHYRLGDPRAAEDLYRSLIQVLSDGSAKEKSEAALYAGDWPTARRILRSQSSNARETAALFRNWQACGEKLDGLDLEFEKAIDRFRTDWDLTNFYVDFLRSRAEFGKGCRVVERWMKRNATPSTPGYLHARLRLGHGYVLAREFEKGRALMESYNGPDPTSEGYRRRVLAECLAGLRHLEEAETLAREAVEAVPSDPEAHRVLAAILWVRGKDAEAAQALSTLGRVARPDEVCEALSVDFVQIFLLLPPERLSSALAAIRKQPSLGRHYDCPSSGFAKVKLWEEATRAASELKPPGTQLSTELLTLYGYRKNANGASAASEWLRKKIPTGQMNRLALEAFSAKYDDLLWTAIQPEPANQPHIVWITRAGAYALRGGTDAQRAQLLAYYRTNDPEPFHGTGRYLLGEATEADVVGSIQTAPDLSLGAYFLGAKAQGEKRYRDACEWYRVAVEAKEETVGNSFALWALSEWVQTARGISKLESRD